MATTVFTSGTQTATIGTEHLYNVNAAGVYTFHVDTSAMAAGDVLELRAYQIVLASGTARVIAFAQYAGAQNADADGIIKMSVPIGNDLTDTQSLSFSLKQTFGTGRAYPYKVLKYA